MANGPTYQTKAVPIEIEYGGKVYTGHGDPVPGSCSEGVCRELSITLNNELLGIIRCTDSGWKLDGVEQGLVNAIGEEIMLWYE
jgi:hypothetical protein